MREIRLSAREHERFLQAMEKRLQERDMTIVDLAEAIGVSERSIYNFRNDTSRNPSKFLGAKIANYLEIRPYEYR